ncbi:MAG: nonstructural protein [Microviridae sp.]|nr:MAG: nonstructural protein [Microviridae sp.]
MAILTIVSVRDSAADLFNRPFYVPNVNLARRSFQDEVNRADQANDMHKHPDDFELYELGYFSEEAAEFEIHPKPKLIVRAKDLKDS